MGYATILGLDLGKFKSVCCATDVATKTHAFETIQTTPQVLREFLSKYCGADPSRVLLVIETCDTAGWVHDLAASLGVNCTVVHTIGDERWRWHKVKRKTDRDDALKLARLALLGELPPAVHMPSPQQRQKRRLIVHRRSVVARRTKSRNAIRSIFSQQGLSLARGNKQWTQAGLTQLKEDARDIAECEVQDLWRGRLHAELGLMASADAQLKVLDKKLDALADEKVALLQGIKGVGPHQGRRPAAGRGGGAAPGRPVPLQERRAGRQLRRAGAQATAERPNAAPRAHHRPRPGAAAEPAGGVGVGGVAAQRLGAAFRREGQPRRARAAQAGDRGAGPQAADHPVGDAEDEQAVPLPGRRGLDGVTA